MRQRYKPQVEPSHMTRVLDKRVLTVAHELVTDEWRRVVNYY